MTVGTTPSWEILLLSGVQGTFSLCSSPISTYAPAGVSNTNPHGAARSHPSSQLHPP